MTAGRTVNSSSRDWCTPPKYVTAVHRVLGDLVTSGWVHQDDSRRYHPGRRMHALAVLMNDDGEISWQARPILDELREVTGPFNNREGVRNIPL